MPKAAHISCIEYPHHITQLKNNISCMKQINGGYTLMEMIIAMVIFSVVMLGGMSFFSFGQKSLERSKQISFATSLGNGTIEHCSTMPWNNNPASSNITTAVGPGNLTYTCKTTITPVTVGSMKIKNIQTAVTWPQQTAQVDFITAISSPVVK